MICKLPDKTIDICLIYIYNKVETEAEGLTGLITKPVQFGKVICQIKLYGYEKEVPWGTD